ncbi:hypothetical protein F2P81_011784 [Scophthalmus maximus]|uniref:Uncharacterized protein n=1 Tax=Scophthalmus maximus TaxID=52904 RepID=A0A6A4T2L5_SCOMX|nr:hypothetical protein F2P81_011784 [Scophthalmus maximus]
MMSIVTRGCIGSCLVTRGPVGRRELGCSHVRAAADREGSSSAEAQSRPRPPSAPITRLNPPPSCLHTHADRKATEPRALTSSPDMVAVWNVAEIRLLCVPRSDPHRCAENVLHQRRSRSAHA